MLSAAVSASPSIQAGMASASRSASEKPATNAAVASSSSRAAGVANGATPPAGPAGPAALRFEDLTIDDALPPLPRLRRYVRSGIALQRLVHVKMLGEVAAGVG